MAVHGLVPVTPVSSSSSHPLTPVPDLSSGLMEWMDVTQPSAGRRSLMKTASLESIIAGRSFMRTTVCCQGTGITLSDSPFSSNLCTSTLLECEARTLLFLYFVRYQTSDTEYETPKGYHHPDNYYDDDEQPLYRESRRSPKRRLLPATPQGMFSF